MLGFYEQINISFKNKRQREHECGFSLCVF